MSFISLHINRLAILFTAQNVTAEWLVFLEFNLAPWQISGAPDWFNLEHYDIQVKPERLASRNEIYSMLRTLLADRFHLVMQSERKYMPIYNLVLEKGGPKIAINETGGAQHVGERQGHLAFRNAPISRLIPYLSTEVGVLSWIKPGWRGATISSWIS